MVDVFTKKSVCLIKFQSNWKTQLEEVPLHKPGPNNHNNEKVEGNIVVWWQGLVIYHTCE